LDTKRVEQKEKETETVVKESVTEIFFFYSEPGASDGRSL